MEIKMLSVKAITPYDKNPRKNDVAVDAVAASIKEFGFRIPILLDKNGTIIAGHTRLKAATKLGLKEVPCIYADDLNEEQVKALRLADNKTAELADWDFDLLNDELLDIIDIDMTSFGFEELLDARPDLEDEEDFDVDAEVPAIVKAGERYQLGNHILMCGDSTNKEDVTKLLRGGVADLLLTDPPYNVNYSGGTKDKLTIANDDMDDSSFYQFLIEAFANADSVMRPGAAFYIWHADSNGLTFRRACNDAGWQIRQCLIWVKNSMVLGRQDYQWKHEPCLYGWKDGASHYFVADRTETTVREDDLNEEKTTILRYDKPTSSKLHPTMKPVKLMGDLIYNSSRKGDNVLDLFGGSGTTLIACEETGRNCYMMEYDPHYCDVIISRWEALTGKKAIAITD
jgi:site-specific DNA-methyltransferase (adenine-specific)